METQRPNDMKKFLDDIPSIQKKYSQSSKNYDHLYSYHTVEKLRENNLKRVVCNLFDPTDKVKIYPSHSNLEVIDLNKKQNNLPTIRMICPLPTNTSMNTALNPATLKKNKVNDNADLERNQNEVEESLEERQKILFIKRNQERKLKRILTIQKLNTFIPEVGRYSPNYRSIEKKSPSALIFSYSDRQEKKEKLINPTAKEQTLEKTKELRHNAKSTNQSFKKIKTFSPTSFTSNQLERSNLSLTTSNPKLATKCHSTSVVKKERKEVSLQKNLTHIFSFKRMRGRDRSTKSDVYQQNAPTLGTYNPKFNCIEKHKTIISFNGKISEASNKKYIISKIIRSYDIKGGYTVMQLLSKTTRAKSNLLNAHQLK